VNELQRQLIEKLGAVPAQPAVEAGFDPAEHLDTPWFALLRRARAPGGPEVPPKPSLAAARQLTDRLAKAMEQAGDRRGARTLKEARDEYLARRERRAWALVKERFEQWGLAERAYRALKQGGADPEKVLQRLERGKAEELRALGADRLRDLLLGPR
jgi:hypothetical protein